MSAAPASNGASSADAKARQKLPRPATPNARSKTGKSKACRRPKTGIRSTRPSTAGSSNPKTKKKRKAEASQRRLRNDAARTTMRRRVAALNDGFSFDFDLARLPRVGGDRNKLKINFIVPKRQLVGTAAKSIRRAVCFLSPQKLEQAFLLSPQQYVGEYGANPRGSEALHDSRSRYTGALEFLTAGLGVLVSITMLDPDGSIRFIDGKHRFCVYRDLGLSCIPLLVPASQKGTFKKRFKAPAASRKIVRCCTKTVKGSKAKFDPRYNSWCQAIRRGETSGTQSGTQSGTDSSAVAGGRGCQSGPGLGTAASYELELDGNSESDGEDLAIDSEDDDGDSDSDGDDDVDDDDDDDDNLDLDDLDDADNGPAAMPGRRGSAAVAAAAIKLLDDISPPRETRRGRPAAWS